MKINFKFLITLFIASMLLASCATSNNKKGGRGGQGSDSETLIDPTQGVELSLFIEEKDRTYPYNVELMTNVVRNALIALKWDFTTLSSVSKEEKETYKARSLYSSPMYDIASNVPGVASDSSAPISIVVRTYRVVGNKTIVDFTVYNSTNETEIKKIMNILASQIKAFTSVKSRKKKK